MTCLESFVRFAEIILGVITRIHVHVRDLLLRDRDKDRDRQRQTDNQRQIDRQTDRQAERDRESQTGRLTGIKTQRETTRKTDRQQKHWYMSHPFSLFPFHAKPCLTRPLSS